MKISDGYKWEVFLAICDGKSRTTILEEFPDLTGHGYYSIKSFVNLWLRRGEEKAGNELNELKNTCKALNEKLIDLQNDINERKKRSRIKSWDNDPRTIELKRSLDYYKSQSKELLTKGHQIFMNQKTIRVVIPKMVPEKTRKTLKRSLDKTMKEHLNAIPCLENFTNDFVRFEYEIEEAKQ